MARLVLPIFFLLTSLVLVHSHSRESRRRDGICPWMYYKNTHCLRTKFLCDNKICLDRSLYCDGKNDCGDNSDEYYCNEYDYCQENRIRCDYKCIPKEWFCDGIPDCADGQDERSCGSKADSKGNDVISAFAKALHWLYHQRNSESATEVWGKLVDKSAVALYFSDGQFINGTRKTIAYEASIQLLSKLHRTKLENISSNDLASFLNAFLVSCIDPRKFHGVDIVQELRNRVDRQNYTNPYVLLSLCNAGEKITESDKMKLIDNFENKRKTFWTDMQAYSIMALVCANNQQENGVDIETLHELTLELKQHQYRNGSVESLQTTALVMQALFSAEPDVDPDNFDETKALEQIISSQKADGSFGNLMNTYFVIPVLACKSLVNISFTHCKAVRREDEMSALEDLANRSGPKKRVQYSIWIGNEKDLERNLVLRVPLNMSLYGIMEMAAEVDNRYSFEYVVKNRKTYINALSGLQDNPEKDKFWFLYVVKDGQPIPAQESPNDVMPVDNDHYVMWYRSGSWVD